MFQIKKSIIILFALVLMSDGLPEAPNHDGEMLDYPAVKKCIKDKSKKWRGYCH